MSEPLAQPSDPSGMPSREARVARMVELEKIFNDPTNIHAPTYQDWLSNVSDRANGHAVEEVKMDAVHHMQHTVAKFREAMARITGNIQWDTEERMKTGYRQYGPLGYDGPDDVRRPRDLDPVQGWGEMLSQYEQAKAKADLQEEREMRHHPGIGSEAQAWRAQWAPINEGRRHQKEGIDGPGFRP